MNALPPLSLYIHFPWCVSKCPYCDFNSHTLGRNSENNTENNYISAVKKDLALNAQGLKERPIHSIFFGGGTPSLCSATGIAKLIGAAKQHLSLAPDCEITLEANPNSAEAKKFQRFREAGINRLSLGIQSFNPQHLKSLGRAHSRDDAFKAVKMAQHAGFDSINLDLMFALPQQTRSEALDDLQQAIALEPSHISHYQLTLEPNTAFYHNPPPLPDNDLAWDMQNDCQALLKTHGYQHYEVSAYAQKGQRCRHNLNYWLFGDYLGIGAGAHGKISQKNGNGAETLKIIRKAKFKYPNAYMQAANTGAFTEDETPLSNDDKGFEFMLNALRLTEGFDIKCFEQRTGQSIEKINDALTQAKKDGLIECRRGQILATPLGWQHLNALILRFLPA